MAASLRQTYQLAHTAQCKLHIAADRRDRNLRFLVGHAMHLDSLLLRIVEIEESDTIAAPVHASNVKFKGAGGAPHCGEGNHQMPAGNKTTNAGLRRSPPPRMQAMDDEDDEDYDEDEDEGDGESDEDQDELSLVRFPSGAAAPPRPSPPPSKISIPVASTHVSNPPPLDPSDNSSSDEEEDDDPPTPPPPEEAVLKQTLQGKGDAEMASLFNKVQKCPCHGKTDMHEAQNFWELPDEGHGRRGVVELKATA
ncbi:hypothetical protein K402DRAFT_390154 [Aulographum hederae CBS 113979]|uniref:Uncharacterized protein n=1 Tax=Aulographum hederae CBS 113979 TaxID=1176131 RepID=A0A6G1HBW1_9PEZI|nr:hypothetical protein K402DRAFT_390154 [Aulographum hederae CBS 113979]